MIMFVADDVGTFAKVLPQSEWRIFATIMRIMRLWYFIHNPPHEQAVKFLAYVISRRLAGVVEIGIGYELNMLREDTVYEATYPEAQLGVFFNGLYVNPFSIYPFTVYGKWEIYPVCQRIELALHPKDLATYKCEYVQTIYKFPQHNEDSTSNYNRYGDEL